MHRTFVQPFWEHLARGIAGQFGDNCEVVIHDLTRDPQHSIVYIENGHVTGRKAGGGPSKVVLEALSKKPEELHDRINYLTEAENGRILKSSTIYIRDNAGNVVGILGINYDITNFTMMDHTLKSFLGTNEIEKPEKISNSVHGLLEELIEQSVRLIGKPVPQMNREDKIRAIQSLHDAGAFLITKSGDRISKFFGISKYTLYNYIDLKDGEISSVVD
jgi:predicted transcriptional regulator YheO